MVELNLTKKIGDFIVIKSGELIIDNNKSIEFEISDGGEPLIFKIEFVNQKGRDSVINQDVSGNTQIMRFLNFERTHSINGLFEPIEIGKINNDGQISTLYFNCIVYTHDPNLGNRIFKYSFLTK